MTRDAGGGLGRAHRGTDADPAENPVPDPDGPAAPRAVLIHTREDGWELWAPPGASETAWTPLSAYGACPHASPRVAQAAAATVLAGCGFRALSWNPTHPTSDNGHHGGGHHDGGHSGDGHFGDGRGGARPGAVFRTCLESANPDDHRTGSAPQPRARSEVGRR